MTEKYSEQEIRLEVIKALINSPQATMLRGDITVELHKRANVYVDYIMGKKPKAPKPEKKDPTPEAAQTNRQALPTSST
jgi:hypothetical protein